MSNWQLTWPVSMGHHISAGEDHDSSECFTAERQRNATSIEKSSGVEQIAQEGDRYLPVAWRWQAGAPTAASACEMALDEEPRGAERLIKHKMPDQV
jgi:hypothetical protein